MVPPRKPIDGMIRLLLRFLALVLMVAALGSWLATGANRGWTKTSVPVKRTDDVTGITVDVYQKRFVPGVEVLGAALLGAAALFGASFLCRKSGLAVGRVTPCAPPTTQKPNPNLNIPT